MLGLSLSIFFLGLSLSTSLLFVLTVMYMYVFFNKLMIVPVVWEGYSCLNSLLILISGEFPIRVPCVMRSCIQYVHLCV